MSDDSPTKVTEPVASCGLLSDALKGLIKLLDDGDLVRNTDGDGDFLVYLAQGTRITLALKAAQEALEIDKSDNEKAEP